MRVYVAGNSHVGALAAAPPLDGVTVFAFGNGKHETETFSRAVEGGVALLPDQYAANLRRFTGRDVIAPEPGVRWALLQVNHNARVYRDDSWLTHEPAEICAPGRAPVSRGLVRTVVERDHAGVRTFLTQLLAAGLDPVAVSAPWPRRDHPAIARGIRPEVVAWVDTLARSVWASWLAERGITLLAPPPGTSDADGFLRPDLAAVDIRPGVRDVHHANASYGGLVLGQLSGVGFPA